MKSNPVVHMPLAFSMIGTLGAAAALGDVYQHVSVGGGAPYLEATDTTLRGSALSRSLSWTNNAWEHTGSSSASAWAQ